jgi:MFS transporter, PAT family, beta-lactamase induction signal transducer AmpG
VLTALASLPVLATREPPPPTAPRTSPVLHFLRLPGIWRVLTLILVYKAGEAFAQGMLRPFLIDRRFTTDDIALMLGTVGFISGMAGALTGGALVVRFGRKRALVAFGVTQALAVAGYAFLAAHDASETAIYTFTGIEHFTSGMATAALFTCMMDWSRVESSGTDYTVQASAVVIATGVASTLSGVSADALGYAAHFVVATCLCLLAVVVAAVVFPRQEQTS